MARSIIPSALSTVALSLALLLPPAALAQHGGHHGGFGGGYSSGHTGGYRGGYGSYRGAYGGSSGYGGFRFGYGGCGGYYSRGFYPRYGYYPRYYGYYGYPRWGFSASFGYGYWPYYDYNYWWPRYYYYPAYPKVVIVRGAVPHEAADSKDAAAGTQPASTGRYWLIAFKNDTTIAVTDYWLEDSTLNYVTRQGVKSSVELSKVDLEFTKQLNQGRGMEFQLPRPRAQYQPKRHDAYGRAY